jgi:hypothetical protein
MISKKRTLFGVVLVALVALALVVCFRAATSGLNGTWLKKTGARYMADEMRISVENGKMQIRCLVSGGMETTILELDGHEHVWSVPQTFGSFEVRPFTVYSARMDKSTVYLTKWTQPTWGPKDAYVEQWSVRDGGRQLVISSPQNETVYQRAPFTRALFVGTP